MHRIRVDFPDPDGPQSTRCSPRFTVRFTPLRICALSYHFSTPTIWITSSMMSPELGKTESPNKFWVQLDAIGMFGSDFGNEGFSTPNHFLYSMFQLPSFSDLSRYVLIQTARSLSEGRTAMP